MAHRTALNLLAIIVLLTSGSINVPWAVAAPSSQSVSTALQADRFLLPDRDLPTLDIGNTHVVFCANGTFIVRRGTEYLMDGGVSFASEGWARWGQQTRNGRQTSAWRSDAAGLSLQR